MSMCVYDGHTVPLSPPAPPPLSRDGALPLLRPIKFDIIAAAAAAAGGGVVAAAVPSSALPVFYVV